jgi:hypothetical protein
VLPLAALAAADDAATSIAATRAWDRAASPWTEAPVTGLAVGPAGVWLAGDGFGTVWRSDDAGKSWTIAQRPLVEPEEPDDEALLLDAEMQRDDEARRQRDQRDEAADDEAAEDRLPTEAIDREDVGEDAAAAALREAGRRGMVAAAADSDAVPWFLPSDPTIALVGRPDGIWLSTSSGLAWRHVDDSPGARAFGFTSSGVILAGTESGLLQSPDGGVTWIDIADATDGAHVVGFAEENGAVWAATDRGLYRTRDGLHWSPASGVIGGVGAVVADPNWDGGIWAATRDGLWRSDDDGATWRASGRQPLAGLRGITPLPQTGHLLAWGGDGVWETVDGGATWVPAVRMLRDPDVRGLALDDGLPVIATAGGIWRTVPRPDVAPRVPVQELPIYALIDAAVSRKGLRADTLALGRRAILARFLPQLRVYAEWYRHDGRDSAFLEETTSEDDDDQWKAYAVLCFGCNSLDQTDDITSYYDESGYFGDLDELDGPDLFVLNGEVLEGDQVVLAAASVAADINRYRVHLAEVVADAYVSRARLLAVGDAVNELGVPAQVEHRLKLAEMEARLDLYTDGALQRAKESP